MKKSGFFAVSAAAASATAISSLSSSDGAGDSKPQLSHEDSKQSQEKIRSDSADKFAPRFDGLRFIETLVTAHR